MTWLFVKLGCSFTPGNPAPSSPFTQQPSLVLQRWLTVIGYNLLQAASAHDQRVFSETVEKVDRDHGIGEIFCFELVYEMVWWQGSLCLQPRNPWRDTRTRTTFNSQTKRSHASRGVRCLYCNIQPLTCCFFLSLKRLDSGNIQITLFICCQSQFSLNLKLMWQTKHPAGKRTAGTYV